MLTRSFSNMFRIFFVFFAFDFRPSDPDGSKDQTVDLVVGTTTTVPKSKSDVAEELMSQMHDLSFMLETKLSVPPISKTE